MTLKFFFASSCLASLLLCSVVAQNTNEKEFNNIVASIIQDGDEAYGKDGDYKPFDYTKVKEQVVQDHGNKCVRTEPDKAIDEPSLMVNKANCFIVISKKDYYLYVYEAQGKDTVMLARYDCCFGQHVGNKQKRGDKKTPSSCNSLNGNPFANAFYISQIQNASSWMHDFKDGRGSIKAYGDFFLRLVTPGHSGIGIHGSTNNAESVPGRASEGCIRLRDADIKALRNHYARERMKVIIKDEKVDDLPFEIKAMRKQKIERKRHFDPAKTINN
ncbi:MAG: L,D-transpeptidase [Prevotella sp.]|nr:L,D-transpeptidase [Prevotella sp.]